MAITASPVHGSSGPTLAANRFASFLPSIQPSLERFAHSCVGDFAEDVVADCIYQAISNLDRYDFATGEQGARLWLFEILRRRIASAVRDQARETVGIARYAETQRHNECVSVARRAMKEELEERLQIVGPSLSPLETQAIQGMIAGETCRATALRIGRPRRSVNRAKLSALDKCREPSHVQRPNLCARRWKSRNWLGGFEVTIYHAPAKWGAGLAREKLAKLN